jgi:hypothetical protein
MNKFDKLLDDLYEEGSTDQQSLEKTAEAQLFDALREEDGSLSENPFEDLSLADLVKLANESGLSETTQDDPDMQKVAMDTLGGQVMAHSAMHELGLIKVALANGQCRVCKSEALDVEGSSICSTCLA